MTDASGVSGETPPTQTPKLSERSECRNCGSDIEVISDVNGTLWAHRLEREDGTFWRIACSAAPGPNHAEPVEPVPATEPASFPEVLPDPAQPGALPNPETACEDCDHVSAFHVDGFNCTRAYCTCPSLRSSAAAVQSRPEIQRFDAAWVVNGCSGHVGLVESPNGEVVKFVDAVVWAERLVAQALAVPADTSDAPCVSCGAKPGRRHDFGCRIMAGDSPQAVVEPTNPEPCPPLNTTVVWLNGAEWINDDESDPTLFAHYERVRFSKQPQVSVMPWSHMAGARVASTDTGDQR